MFGLGSRYDRVARLLHWLTGAALLAQMAFGFLLDDIAPRAGAARASIINLHKSAGVVLGLLIGLRLLWRLWHRPGEWPTGTAIWRQRAAQMGHRALYACMLLMPLSGYIASNFSKYGLVFFGHAMEPWGPVMPGVYTAFNLVHVMIAWCLTALVAGHVCIALLHAWLASGGLATRMFAGFVAPQRKRPPRGSQ